jgi:RimJ/RimL family protein N-acetyltransferase
MDARQSLVQVLKATKPSRPTLVLPVGDGLSLRPICSAAATRDAADVGLLTDTRNRYPRSFLTEFVATRDQTARWLREVVTANPGKLLFVLEDETEAIGYMGLDFVDWQVNTGEIDAIVRSSPNRPGAMSMGTQAMIAWAREQLQLGDIGVRVRSDNPALGFYRKLGFREVRRIPLRRSYDSEAERVVWSEEPDLPDPELWLVRHRYAGSAGS